MPTFEEYLTYQAPAGFRDELIHGEVILSPSPNRKHADVRFALSQLLSQLIRPDYIVRLDTTHRLGEKESPRPDVFVIGRERWIAAGDGYPEGSPELAIEVLSSSNTGQEMKSKRELYFSDPRCLQIWEVDMETETIGLYEKDPSKTITVANRSDAIYLPGPLSRPLQAGEETLRLAVSDVFDAIVKSSNDWTTRPAHGKDGAKPEVKAQETDSDD